MVKPGYKDSAAGVIPEDWEARPIGGMLEFKNGLNKANAFFGQGTPIVNYMDVFANSGLKAESIAGLVTVTPDERTAYSAKQGDVFFTRTSETVDEIGLSAVLLEPLDDAVFSGFVLRGRDKPGSEPMDVGFKKFCFRSTIARSQIRSSASYTTRALTNGKLLSKVHVPTPTDLSEQNRIGEALSDVDGLIAGLEALIAKKRDLKTATMQQLLTGKTRLLGFGEGVGIKQTELGEIPEDWDVGPLREHLRIRHGKSQKDVVQEDGEFPILATGGVIGRASAPLYSKPSVLIGRKGTIDVPIYMDTPFWTVDTLFYSEVAPTSDPKFLFYKFGFIDWYQFNEASGVPSLSSGTIEGIQISAPSEKSEQEAISAVITDFDKEIDCLVARLRKAKALKQGMMQELLTGRTRLS